MESVHCVDNTGSPCPQIVEIRKISRRLRVIYKEQKKRTEQQSEINNRLTRLETILDGIIKLDESKRMTRRQIKTGLIIGIPAFLLSLISTIVLLVKTFLGI